MMASELIRLLQRYPDMPVSLGSRQPLNVANVQSVTVKDRDGNPQTTIMLTNGQAMFPGQQMGFKTTNPPT